MDADSKRPLWDPPASPIGMIQERLIWEPYGRWRCMIACLLLCQTSRKQLDSVVDEFFHRWPSPSSLFEAEVTEIQDLIRPLGMWRKRSQTLRRFTEGYLRDDWKDPRELFGVGEYGSRSDEIFYQGKLGLNPPNDHALNKYWMFVMNHVHKNKISKT